MAFLLGNKKRLDISKYYCEQKLGLGINSLWVLTEICLRHQVVLFGFSDKV